MISFLSEYKWRKVFDNLWKNLWYIHWVVFDINYEKVIWFTYKKGFLNYDFFLIDNIIKTDLDNIIINQKYLEKKDYYDLIWIQVKNTNNENLWNIDDIEFDLTYKLKYIIIDMWYNLSSIDVINPKNISIKKSYIKIKKNAILSYKSDYVLIEDKDFVKENKKTLENIAKIFINIPTPSYNINLIKYE